MTEAIDQHIRQQALDTQQSFIVQAPAGSGKTELLTQRYLALLSQTEKAPEEIVAITFTRKAAAEMRERILQALEIATQTKPEKPHQQITWQLAKNVMQKDTRQQWRLLDNPNRLRILTLDALASFLCRQLPILSQSVANLSIKEDALPLYQHAIKECFQYCINHETLSLKLQTLLLHLDNRPNLLSQMLVQLLQKREQWLPHILQHSQDSNSLRVYMQTALKTLSNEIIYSLNTIMPDNLKSQLFDCVKQAAQTLYTSDPNSPICKILDYNEPPDENIASLDNWLAIAHCLLKKDGNWRKTVDKRQGFTKATELKQHFVALLNSICDDNALNSALNDLMICPPINFEHHQWQLIEALLDILPILAAQCRLTFFEHGQIDFIELNIGAQQALGSPDTPTDVALQLDYRIKHFLIDEFQDTSITQYKLLETLTAGWHPGDGRTLFLVGDPMQSIYRFREADVSLFLRAKQYGIGEIALTSLTLTQNFRSEETIIEWVNHCFSQVFPKTADINTAAIPYTSSVTSKTTKGHVTCHPLLDSNSQTQAHHTYELIKHYQSANPQQSIAILVRSRNHLIEITKSLSNHNIAYEAVDIDPLHSTSEILELLTLTRALLHRADRIAWLALLRAPYCGLQLADIDTIANRQPALTLWQTIQKSNAIESLSQDAKSRLSHLNTVLKKAFTIQGTMPFYRWLKEIWVNLNIAANYTASQIENCDVFFECLLQMQTESIQINIKNIQQRLFKLFAKPDIKQTNTVKLMTIHKSKGLEFDHVILPELNRKTMMDKNQLLLWQERLNNADQRDLIMSPMKHITDQHDPIYHYLSTIEKQKSLFESQRLLYVAATRAKKSLDLIFSLCSSDSPKQPYKAPVKNSFAGMIWTYYKNALIEKIIEKNHDEPTSDLEEKIKFKRFKTINFDNSLMDESTTHLNHDVEIHIEENYSTILGTVVHSILEQLSTLSLSQLKSFDMTPQQSQWRQRLSQSGIPNNKLIAAMNDVNLAIKNTLTDERGLWLLNADREHAYCEYPVTVVKNTKVKHLIIDRWFIDSDNILWIIDYKITHKTDDTEQYKHQLEQYADALKQLHPKLTIKTALYLPLTKQFIPMEPVLEKIF